MKSIIYFGALLLMMMSFISISYGQTSTLKQQTEALRQKQEQRNFYRQTLQVDSVKADQVSEAQNTYKDSLKAVMADTTLNDGAKRAKIQSLMESKNLKLKRLLNAAQQQKLIPTTERISSKSNEINK